MCNPNYMQVTRPNQIKSLLQPRSVSPSTHNRHESLRKSWVSSFIQFHITSSQPQPNHQNQGLPTPHQTLFTPVGIAAGPKERTCRVAPCLSLFRGNITLPCNISGNTATTQKKLTIPMAAVNFISTQIVQQSAYIQFNASFWK